MYLQPTGLCGTFHVMNQLIRSAASAFEDMTVWRFIDSIIIFEASWYIPEKEQEAQLMLTTGAMRLAVSRGQQTWHHFGSVATFR